MRSSRALLRILAAAWLLALPRAARADEPPDPPSPRPTPPDERAGKPTLALQMGYQTLMGSAEQGRSHRSVIGWGLIPTGLLGIGVHRHFSVEAWGSYGGYGAVSSCQGCKGTSLSMGLAGTFHLLDGVPLDPWLSVGAGYRQTTLTIPALGEQRYSGLTALRLAMGGTYFFVPAVGLGPFVEFTAGRYLDRSPGPLVEGSGHTSFAAGLRVELSPF